MYIIRKRKEEQMMRNLKNKNMNKNIGAGLVSARGITLIALVFTIVILIILAGVAISLSLGKNGIFTKAQKATGDYANEQERERVEIAKTVNKIDKYVGGNRNVNLNDEVKSYIDNKLNKSAITVSSSSLNTALTTTLTKYSFTTVDAQKGTKLTLENGEVKIGKGINYVLIFGDICLGGPDQSVGELVIYKNNSEVLSHNPRLSGPSNQKFASTSKVISVAEGDTLSFWSVRGSGSVNLINFSLTVVEL